MSFEITSVQAALDAEPVTESITLSSENTQPLQQFEFEPSATEQALIVGIFALATVPIIIAGYKKDQRSYDRKHK